MVFLSFLFLFINTVRRKLLQKKTCRLRDLNGFLVIYLLGLRTVKRTSTLYRTQTFQSKLLVLVIGGCWLREKWWFFYKWKGQTYDRNTEMIINLRAHFRNTNGTADELPLKWQAHEGLSNRRLCDVNTEDRPFLNILQGRNFCENDERTSRVRNHFLFCFNPRLNLISYKNIIFNFILSRTYLRIINNNLN